jgi:excisionase family DNA binding protein
MDRRFLNTKEMAEYLCLSECTIRAWVKMGRIPFSKLGRAVRFDLHKIEPWLKGKACNLPTLDFHLRQS